MLLLTDWLNDQVIGWLSGWLTDCLTVWLADRLTDWLDAGWKTSWLCNWLTFWLQDPMLLLAYWLNYQLIDWLSGLLTHFYCFPPLPPPPPTHFYCFHSSYCFPTRQVIWVWTFCPAFGLFGLGLACLVGENRRGDDQTDWLTFWLTHWLSDCLTVWLACCWQEDWLTMQLIDWLIDSLTTGAHGAPVHWLAKWTTLWLTFWLTHWLPVCLTGW